VAFIGVGDADVSTMAVAALFGVRWEAPQLGWVTPFVSAGVGPAYYRTKFDDGVTQISNGNVGLGYSARTGVEAPLFGRFSVEAAYRYLNATADAAVGQHAGELGLIYDF
jgi:opacity protein-like surface antigen